jgi:hypothetical protein
MAYGTIKNNVSTPATPSTGYTRFYFDSVTKTMLSVDDSGIVTSYSPNVLLTDTVTTNTTLDSSYDLVLCNSATDITITLPLANSRIAKPYYIKNINIGVVTVDGSGSETIDNELTKSLISKDKSFTIISNGSAWFII